MEPLNSSCMYVLVGTSSTGKTSIMNKLAIQKENLRIDGMEKMSYLILFFNLN